MLKVEERCCCECLCCDDISQWWNKRKWKILGKTGMITVSALNSLFTILDVYTGGSFTVLKYVALGLLNVGIVASTYLYSQMELKSDILDTENQSLKQDKNELVKRLTTFHFPQSITANTTPQNLTPSANSTTYEEMQNFNDIYLNNITVSAIFPAEPLCTGIKP